MIRREIPGALFGEISSSRSFHLYPENVALIFFLGDGECWSLLSRELYYHSGVVRAIVEVSNYG